MAWRGTLVDVSYIKGTGCSLTLAWPGGGQCNLPGYPYDDDDDDDGDDDERGGR